MRILISVDIEGVAGVVHTEQTRPGNAEYERARRWMTQEANAAIRGAFEGGATVVQVCDSHGSYRNLLPDDLDPRARIALGKPRTLGMLGGLETGSEAGFDGLMLVGHHARAQAPGVLAHTINSSAFARVLLNGQELGEAGLCGALAGEYGVPVIFASGDSAFVTETRPLFPHAVFVTTKQTLSRHSAISLTPLAACTAIADGAQQAVTMLKATPPQAFRLAGPLEVQLQTLTPAHADLFCQWPTLDRVDGVTLRFQAPNAEHAVRILNCLSAMAFMLG